MDYMEQSVGLSQAEAQEALKRCGRNEIRHKPRVGALKTLAAQVKSPLVYVLVLASLVNFFVGEGVDSLVIILTVAINTLLGFVQEYKAERSLESLSELLLPMAKVKRGSDWLDIKACLIVPGDIVRLEIGQRVPADGVLTRADNLFVNESVLTGESMPVEKTIFEFDPDFSIYKFQLNEVHEEFECFMGTAIERGLGEMLVIRTGMETNVGKIAERLSEQRVEATPLQQKLARMAKIMVVIFLATIPVVVGVGVIHGRGLYEILLLAVALAVSAIPEGLMVGLTVILTVGMERILKRKALVRKLTAAETLGSVDVICLDKTGTVTEGKMRVVRGVVDANGGGEPERLKLLMQGAILCNDDRDPLETAMMEWGKGQKTEGGDPGEGWKRVAGLPFDHRYKYVLTRHEKDGGK